MKVPHTRAALRRYDLVRDEVDHQLDPALPAEPGEVHAINMHPPGWSRILPYAIKQLASRTGIVFAESGPWEAECGARVKVAFPFPFDSSDADRCSRCSHWLELKQRDEKEYEQQKREWRRVRRERDIERENVEDWEKAQARKRRNEYFDQQRVIR